jgi:hypothetical protein
MNKLVLAVTVLILSVHSFAETPNANSVKTQQEATARLRKKTALEAVAHNRFSTAKCSFTFTSGFELASLRYCVTANGNIIHFEAPKGTPLIATDDLGEGYGVCDTTSGTEYTDYGGFGDSGNWGPATVVSHDAKSVKITRTTADSSWTLTQTITRVTGAPSAKIAMALTNNTSVPRQAFLLRYADADADSRALNNLDGTNNSAFAWNSISSDPTGLFGLVLQEIGTVRPNSTFGYAQNTFHPPAPCNAFANSTGGLLTSTDGSLVMIFKPVVGSRGTVTETVAYRGW